MSTAELIENYDYRHKYVDDPFIHSVARRINPRNKLGRVSVEQKEVINAKTGEYETMKFVEVKQVDPERFVKVYYEGIVKHAELSKTAQKVFKYMYQVIQSSPKKNQIILAYEIANQEPYNFDWTKKTFNKGIAELCQKAFIAQTVSSNLYWINPNYIFNGNRIELVKAYQLKKNK